MQHNGPTTVDISSYNAFRNEVNGNGYDVDGVYGDQCVDAFKLLNYNLGYPSPYAKTGSLGYSEEMWTNVSSREWNADGEYDLIYDIQDVKRGDMMVFAGHGAFYTGHNAFADEDYDPSHPGYISALGQNQGGTPYSGGGAFFNVTNLNMTAYFLGAFRLRRWQNVPPTPSRRHKFPWFIIAAKKRQSLLP